MFIHLFIYLVIYDLFRCFRILQKQKIRVSKTKRLFRPNKKKNGRFFLSKVSWYFMKILYKLKILKNIFKFLVKIHLIMMHLNISIIYAQFIIPNNYPSPCLYASDHVSPSFHYHFGNSLVHIHIFHQPVTNYLYDYASPSFHYHFGNSLMHVYIFHQPITNSAMSQINKK